MTSLLGTGPSRAPSVRFAMLFGLTLTACVLPGTTADQGGESGQPGFGPGGAPGPGAGGGPGGHPGEGGAAPGSTPGQGGAPAPSGGTPGAGGGAPSGGTPGGSGTPGAIGGYIRAGAWQGYAWTAAAGQSSISPMDFRERTDFPLCARGSVGAGFANVAMLGWNLNQDSRDGQPAMTVTPAQDGIRVRVSNPGNSPLRLQIQGPNGATDPNDRWCAPIPGTGGFIPYDAFNTQCWAGGMGSAYTRRPIVAAIVLVPGAESTATPFDFCVQELTEARNDQGMMMPGTGCALQGGPGEGGGSITGDEIRVVTRAGRTYIVQNNVWNGNKQAQRLSVRGVAFTVESQGNSQGTSGAPASFPSTFIGSNFGRVTQGSNLPKRVSSLTRVPTAWRWTSASGTYNAAYDVWFSRNPGGDSGAPTGGYLMVWLYKPGNAQPLGRPVGVETVAGRSWQVWTCPGACQNGVPAISYVPANNQSIGELSFDLADFIRNARMRYPDTMQDSWYLTNIFAGFEIWSGGQGLRTDDFCAVVE